MPKKQILQERGIVRVTFELPPDVRGRTVHLVGDFTSWKGVPMERRGDGGWQVSADLEPGRSYEFRYLIDGERWENDWAADRYVRNPFGHENSVVDTPDLPGRPGQVTGDSGAERPAAQAGTARRTAKKAGSAKAVKKAAATGATKAAKKAAPKSTATKKAAAKKTTAKKAAAKKTTRKSAPPRPGEPGPEGESGQR